MVLGGMAGGIFAIQIVFLVVASPTVASCQTSARITPYPLQTWNSVICRSKGRFQDRGYCGAPVMDQIVADGKLAIPVLISQITDKRWIARPVFDFWPRIRVGELAFFILSDLFLDDTWTVSTMPPLFAADPCSEPGWVCWERFRKTHSLRTLQLRWFEFWRTSRDRIYWDARARCYRLSDTGTANHKH